MSKEIKMVSTDSVTPAVILTVRKTWWKTGAWQMVPSFEFTMFIIADSSRTILYQKFISFAQGSY